jgi:hypothetical protein
MLLVTLIDTPVREPTQLITLLFFFNKFLKVHIRNVKIAPNHVHIIPRHANFIVSPSEGGRVLVVVLRQASQNAGLAFKTRRVD